LKDAISSYSGLRPIVAGGKDQPSAESRESAIWSGPGWIGITGGKLTTFRLTARHVLVQAARQLPILAPRPPSAPAAAAPGRMQARYGAACVGWLARSAWAGDRDTIPGTPYSWGELRWCARQEAVQHLDDLLLRRTRYGLLLPQGGAALLDRVGAICREELGWDSAQWTHQRSRYLELWRLNHAVSP
jgi:glycerol-3-phosphate dehydrogenase